MSRLAEHLADLTGFRDRDVLDVTLTGALKDLLQPHAVAIYRSIGDPGNERWLTRARLGAGELVASADPAWAELSSLPELASNPERLACLQSLQIQAVAGDPHITYFPLASEREVLGVVQLETLQPLQPEDLRMVGSLLRIYRNFQGLLDYSERDTLTGLLNRKTFDESFLRMSTQTEQPAPPRRDPGARRAAPSLWLGVIDIDHFKRVNDGYGHLIGDEVLLLMSRLMRSNFRFQDHLYRFGGEEFVVLMRCGSGGDAGIAFERLRANVERYTFPQVGRITVSVGFTEVRKADTPASAFDRADKAVYYAKQNGRNQVRHHADLVAAGHLVEEARDGDVELF